MTTSIDDLRQRVTFQRAGVLASAVSGTQVVWSDDGEFWASVQRLSALESGRLRAFSIEAASHKVALRYQSQGLPSVGMRMLWDNRIFFVLDVSLRDERKVFVDLLVREDSNVAALDV